MQESLQKIIYPQHILVGHFSLRSLSRKHIRNTAVHVPLDILDFSLFKNLTNLLENIVPDVGSGEIQHKLVPSPYGLPARYLQHPVRMCSVQFAILRHHLRLNPDSEFYALTVDIFNQFPQSAPQLFLVDLPVPETAVVVLSFPEPAIIHDNHIDTERRRALRQF